MTNVSKGVRDLASYYAIPADAVQGFITDVIRSTMEAPTEDVALSMAWRIMQGQASYHEVTQTGPISFDRPTWDRTTDRLIAEHLEYAWRQTVQPPDGYRGKHRA